MNITRTTLALVILTFFVTQAQQPQAPNFKAPPGYTIETKSRTSTYNFYPMKRGIPLPYDRLQMPLANIPKGFSITKNLMCPSKKGEHFYNEPAKALPTFGSPSRKSFQAFSGGGGEGVVFFFEYGAGLPADAKDILSKYFFNKTTPPEPNTQKEYEQFLLADNVIVVWCFRNPKSEVRLKHQEYIFNLIGEVAAKK